MYLTFGTKSHPGYDATVMEQGNKAREEANQVSGRTADSVPIANTIHTEEVDSGGQFKRVKVDSIDAGTPMETVYGLKAGDEITRIGDMGVADNNDYGLAVAELDEAYQRNETLTILRNGEQMVLTPSSSPISKLLGVTKPPAPAIPQAVAPATQPAPGN
jgi:S1-C subfamily serine protease